MKKMFFRISAASIIIATLLFATAAHSSTNFNMKILEKSKPVVILDSGYNDGIYAYDIDKSIETWGKIQPEIKKAKTIAFDRIGIGQSIDASQNGRTAIDRAKQLHTALKNAHINGPYIYVAFSTAAMNARAFTSIYQKEVYGAIFVEGAAVGEAKYQLDWLKANMPDVYDETAAHLSLTDGTLDDILTTDNQITSLPNGLKNKPLVIITSTQSIGIPDIDAFHQQTQKDMQSLSNKSKQVLVDDQHYIIISDKANVVTNEINNMINSFKNDKGNECDENDDIQ